MTAIAYPHIAFADNGAPFIEGTRITVEHIAAERLDLGFDPEAIAEHHPPLTPGQVYMALAYYYDHRDEMDRLRDEGSRMAEELRPFLDESPRIRADLRARGLRS